MVKVRIEDVTDGMIVTTDVSAPDGGCLVSQGRSLSQADIRTMRAFGVQAVDIVSDEPEPDTTLEQLERAEAACRVLLEPRFAALDRTAPFGEALWKLAVTRAARQALAAPSLPEVSPDEPDMVSLPPEQSLFDTARFSPKGLVSGKVELATLPEVHVRLLQALAAPNSTARGIADVLRHDPSLTAKLLRLVNSPLYAPVSPIETIHRAVTVVGQKELTTLVFGLAACSAFADIPPELCDMRAFWHEAAACGAYAATLAEACPGTTADRAFVGGLLHDIGKLVILQKIPAAEGRALLLAKIERIPLHEAERAVLGFDNTAVSRALLSRWHFPGSLITMVADHHQPSDRPEARETAIIHVADILAAALAGPLRSGPQVPPVDDAAWRSLGLPETMLAEVAATGDARIDDIEAVFFDSGRPPTQ